MNRLTLPKTTVGIEIAGGDLRIAVVRTLLNRLQLVDIGEVPGFAELSAEDRRIKIQELRRRRPFPGSHVYLVLPQSEGVTRQVELPAAVRGGRNKLDQIVGLQLESLSPWPTDDIYWGCSEHPLQADGALIATVVVVPKSTLDPHIEFFQSLGLSLSGVSLAPSSWAEGASVLWQDGPPTLMLGCEREYVEGALVAGRRLHMATETGEDTASSAQKVAGRLLALGRVSDPESIRLIFHGGNIDALDPEPGCALPLSNARPDSGHRFGAVAAALMGLRRGQFAANVLPAEMRYRSSRMQLVPTAALLLVALAAGLLFLLREPYQSTLYASRIDAEIERVAASTGEIAGQSERLDRQEERYRVLAGHIRNRDRNLEVLNALARLLPETAWVSNYNYQDGRVTIEGFAQDTAELQRLLEDSPLLGGVRLTAPLTRAASGRDRFTIQFNVEGAP